MLNKTQKFGLMLLGHLCLVLGFIGLFLPVIPTTPFLIGASFCYGRSSEKFQRMLHENKYVGPSIKAWEKSGAINVRTKIIAITMLAVSISVSLYFMPIPLVRIIVAGIVIIVSLYIATRPNA